MNKRGVKNNTLIVLTTLVVVSIVAISVVVNLGLFDNLSAGQIDTSTKGFDDLWGKGFVWLNYLFGGIPAWMVDRLGGMSSSIIVIATFLLMFVTFGDIVSSFSTFSERVSWFAAFLISIIAVNLKVAVYILSFFVGILIAPLGTLAVGGGLLAAFLTFFAVNLGIGRLGPWIMRRKAMMLAEKQEIKSEAGAKKIVGAIKGMKDIGEALANP